MFFNPPFTKSSHVASVLCECLEMASRRCGLLAGLCAPLVLLALVSPVCVYRAPCPGGGGGGGGEEDTSPWCCKQRRVKTTYRLPVPLGTPPALLNV